MWCLSFDLYKLSKTLFVLDLSVGIWSRHDDISVWAWYMCLMQIIWNWTYHVASCCCQNFEEFIKFWSFLQDIKIWFEFVRKSSFQTCKNVVIFKTRVKSPNSDNSRSNPQEQISLFKAILTPLAAFHGIGANSTFVSKK